MASNDYEERRIALEGAQRLQALFQLVLLRKEMVADGHAKASAGALYREIEAGLPAAQRAVSFARELIARRPDLLDAVVKKLRDDELLSDGARAKLLGQLDRAGGLAALIETADVDALLDANVGSSPCQGDDPEAAYRRRVMTGSCGLVWVATALTFYGGQLYVSALFGGFAIILCVV